MGREAGEARRGKDERSADGIKRKVDGWTRERTFGRGRPRGNARIFRAARAARPRAHGLDFWYLPGVNAGRWSPRTAPLYLVTITLGCMKCATGIQPSPHNSPIYDWAKLLSMRRIKSRARVQEKSAGRRDGRPRRRSSRSRLAFPRRRARRGTATADRGDAPPARLRAAPRRFPTIFLRAAPADQPINSRRN